MTTRVLHFAHTNAIRGVEIFAAGEHNGDKYTVQDLDDIVASHKSLDFRPAIKVGHTKDAPGAPAFGWVQNLRREGEKLVADFTDMHDSVVDAIRKKAYDNVSSEIYFNLKRGGKQFRRALKAVALLGAEVPAVANLTPLHKMEFAAQGEYEAFKAVDQSLDVSDKVLLDSVQERLATLTKHFDLSQEQSTMTLKELKDQIAALQAQVKTFSAEKDGDKIAAINAQIKVFETAAGAIERAEQAVKEASDKAQKDRAADQSRIAALEAADRARTVEGKVAALKVPALAPQMKALYTYAVENGAAVVKVYSADGNATDTPLVAALDAIVAQVNDSASKLFNALAQTGSGKARQDGTYESAGDEVNVKVKELQAKDPKLGYADAMEKVFTADAELKRKYTEEQNTRSATRH